MHIVLVHGSGGTPSTWSAVTPVLDARGLEYTLVTNSLHSLEEDVANTAAVVDAIDDDVLLVGHSYGGAVITNVGHRPTVRGLVYVAAFAPEEGESVSDIVGRYDPAPVSAYMRRGENGEWFTDRGGRFWEEIGWDVPPHHQASLIAETGKSSNAIFSQKSGTPAWKVKPTWYLVATRDGTLRTDTQRDMAKRAGAITSEIETSHFTPRVRPDEVADLIEVALKASEADGDQS
ncbi:alpha/beta hydrolase [Lacisediminihabitans profunda]|uniref:Alpha/beta hydrolase n=1 Tax=Lacisediminihabitans profunda TaxID=2594790 RepID=A0A5C8UR32_9MICO|nr:alpha/beta hydrolase [Lacisediminihabitans profunda]TXN30400.1 alpha/beta hydrolase [Lacisediminihabitans profunda]